MAEDRDRDALSRAAAAARHRARALRPGGAHPRPAAGRRARRSGGAAHRAARQRKNRRMRNLMEPIPFLDLTPQFRALETEWLAAIRETGARASFILGPQVMAFEREFAGYVGVKHAIAVANGTDSLVLSLRALGIGQGEEVITTPYTFFASSEAIDLVGATPVFADISPESFTLAPDDVRRRITPKTRAILPVHIFGQPCDMEALLAIAREHRLAVIEDCAQSFGAVTGARVVGSL